MAAAKRMSREEQRLIEQNGFRNNAWKIIEEMVKLSPEHPSLLVDEALHSIFFLGEINKPQITPEEILTDKEMFNELRDLYPRPFELYSSQVPRRSPMSCVLDMIVSKIGQRDERKIRERLQGLIDQLKSVKKRKKTLISSTICVSQNTAISNSNKYYGVSMSTSGALAGQIIVAASCLRNWDSYIAGAVMTYYPDEDREEFDGTIRLPTQVRCQAFNICQGGEMLPCISCGKLFGLTTSDKKWAYGHCAEVESLSNLFKNEREVREQAQPRSERYTDINMQRAKERVRKKLLENLRLLKFKWDKKIYTPQGIQS